MSRMSRSAGPNDADDDKVWERLEAWAIVPVVTVPHAATARPLAQALVAGGLPCAEVTLRSRAALAAIETMAEIDAFLVGAGTVHSVHQAREAVAAGARFVVTPGFARAVVTWCREQNVPVLPGTATPTDLELALELGIEHVKFFPAGPLGGPHMLRALVGPYAGIRFMPTGGVGPSNLAEYLAIEPVFACGGSWMARPQWLENGEWDHVVETTSEAMRVVENVRGRTL